MTVLEEVTTKLGRAATAPHWQRIGIRNRTGICVPLFSLRSQRDCGIGDIGDIRAAVDWCNRIGASVIQVLPLNDMGMDSVPYSALSAFALDPVFIAIDQVPELTSDPELAERALALAARLNEASTIDYQEVRRAKMGLLEQAFVRSAGPQMDERLWLFREANLWLEDYLPYRVIKETRHFRAWEDWAGDFAAPGAVEQFCRDNEQRIQFHLFLQMVLDHQLSEARKYANDKGVLLKGDIPILVSRDSADVWRHPEFFYLDTVAGAPPDMYAEDGQCWGFPTYNWDALRDSDYSWWRQRLQQAQRYYDLYRIDHVVGFFRIWTVRHGAQNGREGWFVPGNEAAWGNHGRTLLQMMLDTSDMLPLAEDLGTIPHVCRNTLLDLGICGLKVQRWEKRWEQDSSIIPASEFHPLSVATLSTHDSETFAGWWEAYPDDRRQLWAYLGREGEPPTQAPPDVQREMIRRLAAGGSLFTILMLQDILDAWGRLEGARSDHRINVPGTVNRFNWSWRCPIPLEDLLADDELTRGTAALMHPETSA